MTRANTEQLKHTPWFAKAGAACSIVPISRFVGPNIFALKGGGYGCLFSLTGIDEEGLTDQELESRASIEGALRGLPEGSCLYQYTRVMSGFDLPRQKQVCERGHETYSPATVSFPDKTAGFRRIDLHWCLTLEPSKAKAFERKPQENAVDTSRMLADLEKTATIAGSHLGSSLGCGCWARPKPSSSSATSSTLRSGPSATSSAAIRRGPADREESGCVA
jgi:type IV secretion system protein VirB4